MKYLNTKKKVPPENKVSFCHKNLEKKKLQNFCTTLRYPKEFSKKKLSGQLFCFNSLKSKIGNIYFTVESKILT